MKEFRIYLFVFFILVISFLVGYITGYSNAISLCIEVGQRITNTTINPDTLELVKARFPDLLRSGFYGDS